MAARAGVEPTTLRLKVIDSTKAPPRPTLAMIILLLIPMFQCTNVIDINCSDNMLNYGYSQFNQHCYSRLSTFSITSEMKVQQEDDKFPEIENMKPWQGTDL